MFQWTGKWFFIALLCNWKIPWWNCFFFISFLFSVGYFYGIKFHEWTIFKLYALLHDGDEYLITSVIVTKVLLLVYQAISWLFFFLSIKTYGLMFFFMFLFANGFVVTFAVELFSYQINMKMYIKLIYNSWNPCLDERKITTIEIKYIFMSFDFH